MNHTRSDYRFNAVLASSVLKERAVNYLIENNPFSNEEDLIERLELINAGEEEFDQTQTHLGGKDGTDYNSNRTNLTNNLNEEDYIPQQLPND